MIPTDASALARLASGPLGLAPDRTAWAEDRAKAVLAVTRRDRVAGACWIDDAIRAQAQGWKPYDLDRGIAVIPVQGLILPSCAFLGWEYATGCAGLRWQIECALADGDVRGIALQVDSPGGFVTGTDETAAAIRAARERKPVAAIVEGGAYSCAYWIASAADSIAVTRTGGVGSVGVMALHWDESEAVASRGVAATIFASGSRKTEGHPLQPLDDAARAAIQAEVDDLAGVLFASVEAGRRGRISADAIRAAEARTWVGPAALAEAQRLGIVDAVLPVAEARDAFAAALAA